MTLGDELGYPEAHHVEVRAVQRHATVHSRPWRPPEVELADELDALEQERAALDDQIRYLRSHGCECLERALDQWERNRVRLEGLPSASCPDMRGVKNAGVDDREAWGEVS